MKLARQNHSGTKQSFHPLKSRTTRLALPDMDNGEARAANGELQIYIQRWIPGYHRLL